MTHTLRITRPDDWHVHLRDGSALLQTVADISRYFGRAIIMPNLVPPVRTVADAQAYRSRIQLVLEQLQPTPAFTPLMVLYLTDNTRPEDILDAARPGSGVFAVKLYPAGATTNSDSGVSDLRRLDAVLDALQSSGFPLLVHGEVTAGDVDIFEREKRFIDDILQPLLAAYPDIRLVLEHISTADAVQFVRSAPANVAATITVHHLMYNRNQLLAGGIRPHYYCLPILKHARHQQALLDAAISGNPKFFLGTDSAPHPVNAKEASCGCAGCYTAHAALEMYAEVFEQCGALDKLEAFSSFFGPDFYRLPRNSDQIELVKETWQVPNLLEIGTERLRPLRAGEHLSWRVLDGR